MKITIDGEDYYSDDFTEEQSRLFQQITIQSQQMAPFEFALNSMKLVQQSLTNQLSQSLSKETEETS